MDIVKRLRAMDEEQFYQAPATSYRTCQDAADEIERLHYELATMQRDLSELAHKAERARVNQRERD